jgi:hypothetical protein
MTMLLKPHATIPTLTVAIAAVFGCGGEAIPGDGHGTPGSVAAAGAAATVPREPLTEADLAGLSLADLSVEIPWTQNRVSRDPGAKAAPSGVMEATASSHAVFDRVLFRFTDSAPFPGYRIEIVDASSSITCGEQETSVDLGAERTLVVRFTPARPEGDRLAAPGRMRPTGAERLGQAGTLCATGSEVVWAAAVTSGDEVRLLELGGPRRLAVDVR